MNKALSAIFIAAAFVVVGSFGISASAYAQVSNSTPVFYSQGGQAMNPNGSTVPAGWYYSQNGDQVYYYGNGTYYDSTRGVYGGQAFGSYTNPTFSTGSTPVFYTQGGQAINPNGTSLAAGQYYLQNGDQAYYYGNGTYYDMNTQTYGGMIFGGGIASPGTPGIPNTGMGGQASINWMILALTGSLVVIGMAYISRRRTVLA